MFILSNAVILLSTLSVAQVLPGTDYATWGIASSSVAIAPGSVITDATVTLYGVTPSSAPFDVFLLDNPRPGFSRKSKSGQGSVFAGHGTRLAGVMQNGNVVFRLGHPDNNSSQSFVWSAFTGPFHFALADGRHVSYTSSLLELIDYAGTGVSFGIGIESVENVSFIFTSLELSITVSSYQSLSADKILTYTYRPDTSVRPSYALQFDGIDDTVTWNYAQPPVNNFTVSAWVKAAAPHEIDMEGLGGGTSGQTYLFWPEHKGADAGMGISVGTNGISVYEQGAGYMPARAVFAGNLGTGWNHIAVTYTNKQPRLYLNGVLVRTGLASPRANVFAPRTVGGGMYGYFSGTVSSIRVWDRPLSDAEVLSSVSGIVAGTAPVGEWGLDQGIGIAAYDNSGKEQHALINGAVWVVAPR